MSEPFFKAEDFIRRYSSDNGFSEVNKGLADMLADITNAKVRPLQDRIKKLEDSLLFCAQSIHQAYHESGTWETCPKANCANIRDVMRRGENG